MKIWFLTRSLYPYQKTGGGQIRLGQIQFLKELKYEIKVILPNYNSNKLNINKNIIQIPLDYNIRFASYLERIGFYEDYFDKWINNSFDYLKDKIKKEDIVFATSGGELGMIKLGSLLKDEINCKFVVNFHDPIAYSLVHGLRLNKKFHISREKQEEKYLKNSNLILTSSESNQSSLQNKYPKWKDKIKNNYFGYIKQINLNKYSKTLSNKLRIAYVGNMGELQQPEILYEVYQKNSDNIEIYFIGDISNYKPLQNIENINIKFINYMPHDEFLKFMIENVDIGFVSLANEYLGVCVPSKIYEYINLGLPMIGALPNGDGKYIINNKNYGMAYRYDDTDGLAKAVKKFQDKEFLDNIKNNILKDRNKWDMKEKMQEVDSLLKGICCIN